MGATQSSMINETATRLDIPNASREEFIKKMTEVDNQHNLEVKLADDQYKLEEKSMRLKN